MSQQRSWRAAISAVLTMAAMLGASASAKEFRFADQRDLPSMDPYSVAGLGQYAFLKNIYEVLADVDSDGKEVPALATGWEVVDQNRWRFHLRRGVKFQDGRDFSADDVVFSLQRAKGANSSQSVVTKAVQSIDKIDDYTVDVVTRYTNAFLPRDLRFFMIMSKGWCEKNATTEPVDRSGKTENFATRNTNGTGPFSLAEWNPNVSVKLDVNDGWWGGKRTDAMTSAKFLVIGEPSTQLAALLTGEVHLLSNVAPALVDRVKAAGDVKLLTSDGILTMMLAMDQSSDEIPGASVKGKNPFKDVRVRRAIAYAVDADALVSRIMRGQAKVTNLPVSPKSYGAMPEFNVHAKADPDRARKLLAEAGYPDGITLPMLCPVGAYVNDQAICSAVQAMLARVGIKTQMDALPQAVFYEKINYPKYEGTFYLLGWGGSDFNSLSTLANLFLTRDLKTKTGLYNQFGYANPEVDRLLATITAEFDDAKRLRIMGDLWTLLERDEPVVPLFQPTVNWAARQEVDAKVDPLGRVSLKDIVFR